MFLWQASTSVDGGICKQLLGKICFLPRTGKTGRDFVKLKCFFKVTKQKLYH